MKELHLTKKDFKLEWISGTVGGQNVNKHRNCCRITHIETGLTAQSTKHRDRPSNQRDAFKRLANLVISHYAAEENGAKERYTSTETIRNYHGVRNEVHDKASGLKMSYKEVVDKGDIEPMIEARRKSMGE